MFSNKKAQTSGIVVIFAFICAFILGAIFLFKWIIDLSQNAVTTGGISGIEAFFMSNMILWIILAMFLALAIGIVAGQR